MTKNYEIPNEDQLVRVSTQDLKSTVQQISIEQGFADQPSITDAISNIVTFIHSSYELDSWTASSVEKILLILRKKPISDNDMDTSREGLAKKPLIIQILILMQTNYNHGFEYGGKRIIWLAIAMHAAVLLKHYNKITESHNILMQFKLAVFFNTDYRRWIWNELPDLRHNTHIGIKEILLILTGILEQIDQELIEVANKSASASIKANKYEVLTKAKKAQIEKILTAYEQAHYPNARKYEKPKPDRQDNVKGPRVKPVRLSDEFLNYTPPNEPTPYHWDTIKDDIEQHSLNFIVGFLEPEAESHEGLMISFEEELDYYDAPYVNYEQLSNELVRHSAPLQTIDLSLQQNYISQRELALNSNVRLLSLAGYQILFKALSFDAIKLKTATDIDCVCAGVLLLSLITALPIKSLMIEGYIRNTKNFNVGKRRAYIQHRLGITERTESFDNDKHENKSDEIKIPIPLWLIETLANNDVPSREEFIAYLKSLRSSLELPYLSLARVESALLVILSRYTPNCNSHIANLICRTPAPHAPAMYYSSHSSEALIGHYKTALSVLNFKGNFALSYITAWHKYTVGSSFALRSDYVRRFIKQLRQWVESSTTKDEHFDRTGVYTWFVFCLLTGVRPNNGIGKTSDIDCNMGWLLINDKPNKSARNHRLVPLCPTLIQHLRSYQDYLIDYQRSHQIKREISQDIDQIQAGDDVSLLRLLAASYDKLVPIKRGMIYKMTKEFIDLNPYWTRHFVRTQLEKLGVSIALINSIIGHEKNRQEVLGKFSSVSKAQIKGVSKSLENIADQLGLNVNPNLPNWSN